MLALTDVDKRHSNTMGPFKLSSNQLIPELGISLQLAYLKYRNVMHSILEVL